MSKESAWLLMRAEARGLSGMLIAPTPTDFRKRAPSTSLRMSVPLGGTISTIVTNSPPASFAPSRERVSIGTAGAAAGPAGLAAGARFSHAQRGLHYTNVIRSRPAAASYQANPGGGKLTRIARHVFRRTKINVAAFHRPRDAGVRLRCQGQGSDRSHALDPLQHCHRSHATVAPDNIRAPLRQPRSKSLRSRAVKAVGIFINRYLRHYW